MLIQLELEDAGAEKLDNLKRKAGLSCRMEVFNTALALLNWAADQTQAGRKVASIDELTGEYSILDMPPSLACFRISRTEAA